VAIDLIDAMMERNDERLRAVEPICTLDLARATRDRRMRSSSNIFVKSNGDQF
jgi:hypothetical protein